MQTRAESSRYSRFTRSSGRFINLPAKIKVKVKVLNKLHRHGHALSNQI
jgi:hypothetical protein